jgi:hypothetical protein
MWNGLVIGLTALLLTRVGRPTPWGGLAYGLTCPLLHRFWDIGQAEHLVNLLVAGSLVSARPVASGALLGAAILTKPVAVLFIPLAVRRKWVWWAAGMAFAVGLCLIPYAAPTAMSRVWEDLVGFNSGYGASTLNADLAERACRAVLRWGAPLWPSIVLATVAVGRHRRIGLWLLLALAGVVFQGKLFTYHWVLLLAPLMLLAGYGVYYLPRMPRLARAVVLAVAVVPWCLMPNLPARTWYPAAVESLRGLEFLSGRISRDRYLAGFGTKAAGADFSALDQDRIVHEIVDRGCTTAVVWGFEPGVNYLSRTPCPIRYVADFPLTFPVRSERARTLRDSHRARFVEEFLAKRPGCVVVIHDDENPVESTDSYHQMLEFPEFAAILARDYRASARIGSYSLWSRR